MALREVFGEERLALAHAIADPRGPIADEIGELTLVLTLLGTLVFFGVLVVLAFALFRRRDDGSDQRRVAPSGDRDRLDLPSSASRRLVIGGGLLLPAIVITVVFAWSLVAMVQIPDAAPDGSLQIHITARQWAWEAHYPAQGITTVDEIHIPVDQPVQLTLRSEDVIHSFWVPSLAGKIDVLPDHSTSLVIEADEVGDNRGQCAEFCGLHHARMTMVVTVHSQADFDQWVGANG